MLRCFVEKVSNVMILRFFGGIFFSPFRNFMLFFWHFFALFGSFEPFTLFCCKLDWL